MRSSFYDLEGIQLKHIVRDTLKGGGLSLYINNSIEFKVIMYYIMYM